MNARKKRGRLAGVVLAAGLGERMQPLTLAVPKPLLPVLGVPLVEIAVARLRRSGAEEIHANTFHLPEQIEAIADEKRLNIRLHRETSLLGTGGGIGNMADALKRFDSILLHNGDIVSNIGFERALETHVASGCLVTMLLVPVSATEGSVVSSRLPPGNVAANPVDEVVGIGEGVRAAGDGVAPFGYTGLSILSPEALGFFPRDRKAGLVEILTEMMRCSPGSVKGFDCTTGSRKFVWCDLGSPDSYLELHRRILVGREEFDRCIAPPPMPIHLGNGAVVDPTVSWSGFLEVGSQTVIGRDCRLEDCVILPDTIVPPQSAFYHTIIYPGGTLQGGDAR
ncbi:MAG: NTP transferase domain-containing protein [bacterium]|nr:MAG: NTP transferase domain-containing protein [bacterium]